jgi:hypothetical protein
VLISISIMIFHDDVPKGIAFTVGQVVATLLVIVDVVATVVITSVSLVVLVDPLLSVANIGINVLISITTTKIAVTVMVTKGHVHLTI